MITVVAVGCEGMDAYVSNVFARSPFFAFFRDETDHPSFEKNPFVSVTEGLGPQVAAWIVQKGAKKIVAGNFGQKAAFFFIQNGVQMITPGKERITLLEITQMKTGI